MLHGSEDLSFSPVLYEGVEIKLSQRTTAAEDLECYGRLFAGDSEKSLDSDVNKIRVQPMIQWWFNKYAVRFVPEDAVIHEILDFFTRNSRCDVYERRRFDQVPTLSNAVYSLAHMLSRKLDRRRPSLSYSPPCYWQCHGAQIPTHHAPQIPVDCPSLSCTSSCERHHRHHSRIFVAYRLRPGKVPRGCPVRLERPSSLSMPTTPRGSQTFLS
ncbi:hypothetical protein CYLTODRAFT_492949 [Cylindrobasidium torrendii FP15055 ss-10]|uniref:Uncharacterized protein n=1 Tax=Cylindrobasidium torrendii FP15055 ss-10 TaxID=1314674 RepID=A0A0D7B369_9AGAR|nr:hypothetical protein CYLTODRAFT_492949 [Cylindrobasidium torrendii FP15055 ss-10]